MIGWLINWLDRRRRSKDWRVVRKWDRRCIWSKDNSNHQAGRIIIIGKENGLGQRDVEMLQTCLPHKSWGDPTKMQDWSEALNWKYEVRAPMINGPRLRIIK